MTPKESHKEIALHLKEHFDGEPNVSAYRDQNGHNPVPIGTFGKKSNPFYSTIGAFEVIKDIPPGNFEFAATGKLQWLPHALASCIYWLKGRKCENWPLICEDVIKSNAKSTYRHLGFVPSKYAFVLQTGERIQWLLGVPITDKEILISSEEIYARVKDTFPEWILSD